MRPVCNTTCFSRAYNFAAQKKIFSSGLPVVWLLVLCGDLTLSLRTE
jgi:hypothetical protein